MSYGHSKALFDFLFGIFINTYNQKAPFLLHGFLMQHILEKNVYL